MHRSRPLLDSVHVVQRPEKLMTYNLFMAVFLTCLGSSFLMGYNMAILNNPTPFVKAFLNRTLVQSGYLPVSINFAFSLTNALYVVGAALGAFSCGLVADYFGRRNGLMFNHAFAIVGSVLMLKQGLDRAPPVLYVARFLLGVNSGITIGVASMYLTEVAPRRLRGAIGACHQLAVTVGIFIAYFFTMSFTLNTENLWPVAGVLSGVPALISLFLLPFFPESPRFLFLKRRDEEATRKAISKLNYSADLDLVIGELREEVRVAELQPPFHFKQLFVQRDLRMPIVLACLIQVMQQLSGINAVISYSSTMFETAGIGSQYKEYCVLAIGLLNVIVTIISLPLLERLGRRSLLLWPTLGLAICLVLLTVFVTLAQIRSGAVNTQAMAGISASLIFVYIIMFALGLGPVPGLIVSEIFRQGPRASAYSLSQGIQWTSNLIVLASYPSMNEVLKGYSFLVFFAIVIVCWVVFFLFMPETKNRTFDEVATDLAFGNVVVGRKTARIEERPMEKSRPNTSTENTQRLLPEVPSTVIL